MAELVGMQSKFLQAPTLHSYTTFTAYPQMWLDVFSMVWLAPDFIHSQKYFFKNKGIY